MNKPSHNGVTEMFKSISRMVWMLSLLSLMNDFSSEMLYPVIPLYLQQIGYHSTWIGLLEGIAECVAGFSKIYLGRLSDRFSHRLPFIYLGYGLSILSRPFIGLSRHIGVIFSARTLDRMGKGMRGAARDALLAESCEPTERARVFGFHRSMDTIGAVAGPLVAMAWLLYYPENYQGLFLITLIPGIAGLLLLSRLREKQRTVPEQTPEFSFRKNFQFHRESGITYLKWLLPFLVFGICNHSDMFLLLRASQLGIPEHKVLLYYVLFNLVFALAAFPLGHIADKWSRKKLLVIALGIYAITYFLFAQPLNSWGLVCAFSLYGLYYAASQGILKALLLATVKSNQKAGAIGFYEGLNSLVLLIANLSAGILWYTWGASTLFMVTAFLSVLIMVWLIYLPEPAHR